jgi:hypothetical protein
MARFFCSVCHYFVHRLRCCRNVKTWIVGCLLLIRRPFHESLLVNISALWWIIYHRVYYWLIMRSPSNSVPEFGAQADTGHLCEHARKKTWPPCPGMAPAPEAVVLGNWSNSSTGKTRLKHRDWYFWGSQQNLTKSYAGSPLHWQSITLINDLSLKATIILIALYLFTKRP